MAVTYITSLDSYKLTPIGVTKIVEDKMKQLFPIEWDVFIMENQEKRSPYRAILKSKRIVYLPSIVKYNMKKYKSQFESEYNKSEFYNFDLDLVHECEEDDIILFLFYISLGADKRECLKIRTDKIYVFIELADAYIPGILFELIQKIDCHIVNVSTRLIVDNFEKDRFKPDLAKFVCKNYLCALHDPSGVDKKKIRDDLDKIYNILPYSMYTMTKQVVDFSFLTKNGYLDPKILEKLESDEEKLRMEEKTTMEHKSKIIDVDVVGNNIGIQVDDKIRRFIIYTMQYLHGSQFGLTGRDTELVEAVIRCGKVIREYGDIEWHRSHDLVNIFG